MTPAAPLLKSANAEPIPGYRLIELLGRGGFGEVWKCEAPGGLYKAIKFVPGPQDELDTGTAAVEELKAVERIKALRHPFLLTMERVEKINDELVIVMELADKNLQDLLRERQAAGKSGIDRTELLGYLREAADVLDLIRVRHNLQHLDIKPANLFLVCDHVKVADFGLVQSLSERSGTPLSPLGAITPRYAAPELFRGRISPTSDQFSLAIVYQELLTGASPFTGRNFRQLMLQHSTGEPDLSSLPEPDRGPVARALAKQAGERYASCREFIEALSSAVSGPVADRAHRDETRTDLVLSTTQTTGPEAGLCFPDMQFLGCLGRTPTGEAWSATAPDGRAWVVSLLYGLLGRHPRQEEESLRRLQSMRHPCLPSRRMMAAGRGCLAVANQLCEMNLKARFQECRAKGGSGLPRRELLDKLLALARALDELFAQHGLPHLGLHPRNLLLEGERVLIGDYGLLPLLFHPAGQLESQLQARYAAPEVFGGQIQSAADVFSLAVIYQEMLTGSHPFRGRPDGRAPQLDGLPAADRPIVGKALSFDPAKRFAGCTPFVEALLTSTREARATLDDFQLPTPGSSSADSQFDGAHTATRLAHLLDEAKAMLPGPQPPAWVAGPDGSRCLEGRLAASLPPTGALGKFEGFTKQWQADLVHGDDHHATFQVSQAARGFWNRCRGAKSCLLVELAWVRPQPPVVMFPEVTVRIRAAAPRDRNADDLLKDLGPALIESIRQQLQGNHERRLRERVLWAKPVLATFLTASGEPGEAIECQGKDLSLTGMGLYLPCALAGAEVRLNLTPEAPSDPVVVTGQFIRVQRCGPGWFEAGVLFQ